MYLHKTCSSKWISCIAAHIWHFHLHLRYAGVSPFFLIQHLNHPLLVAHTLPFQRHSTSIWRWLNLVTLSYFAFNLCLTRCCHIYNPHVVIMQQKKCVSVLSEWLIKFRVGLSQWMPPTFASLMGIKNLLGSGTKQIIIKVCLTVAPYVWTRHS